MADTIRKYTIALRQCYNGTRVFRAKRAINDTRAFISKHMKVSLDNVVLEESINHEIWAKGGKKVVPRITVETEKMSEGKTHVWIAGKRKVIQAPKPEKKEEKPAKKESKKAETKNKTEKTPEKKVEATSAETKEKLPEAKNENKQTESAE